jgi:hypothetical protein
MKTKEVIECHVRSVVSDRWLWVGRFDHFAKDHPEDAAEDWGCSVELIEAIDAAIENAVEQIVDALEEDLKDIWKKVGG